MTTQSEDSKWSQALVSSRSTLFVEQMTSHDELDVSLEMDPIMSDSTQETSIQ